MGFEIPKENYTGSIKSITLGKGDKAVQVGGENCLPFHDFEGTIPNRPKIAMEIWDSEPPEWAEAVRKPFEDCLNNPAAWAKKCVEDYGAEMIVLQLKSTDPNDQDRSADEAVATVKDIQNAVDVPLVLWGTANVEKDSEVLKAIAENCEGPLLIGPVEDANHKSIGAAIMGYGHYSISSSPIDINLAKQINILLENLGLPLDKMIIDPTTGGLGYGMEYSYSIMERIKLASLTFGDDKLQLPIINNLANEVWRCKEAKEPLDENPLLGDPERRAVLMEAAAAVTYIMGGSDILIMRHPEAIRMTKTYINLMMDGGSALELEGIKKMLPDVDVDYASYSPELDLTIEEEAKKAAPKKAEEPKKEEKPAAEAKPEPKKEEPKKEAPKEEAKAEPKKEEAKPEPVQPAAQPAQAAGPAMGAEDLKKLIHDTVKEVVSSMKAEEEEAKKKEKAATAKQKEEAMDKAENEWKKMEEQWAQERAEREKEENKIREERRLEREKHLAEMMAEESQKNRKMDPASEQKSHLDKLIDRVEHFHRIKW